MERSPFIVQLCYIPLRGRKITPGLALSLVLILAAISDHFAPDRCAYPAHTGLGIALIWEIAAPAGARRIPGKVDWVALILVLIPPSLLTTRQSLVWKDAESLWRHAIRAKGPSYLSRNQLGLTPIRNGLVEEGLGELRSAVTENPENPMAKGSLAIACVQNAYLNGGVRHFQEAGTSLPGRERFRAGIIASCLTAGRKDLATTLGKGAVAEDPAQATVRIGSGDYFYGIADHEEAMRHYAEAAKLDPRSSHAAVSIGALLIRRGSVEEANPRYLRTYVRALVANGRGEEAKASAALGLESVATLRATEPLEKPWTTGGTRQPDEMVRRDRGCPGALNGRPQPSTGEDSFLYPLKYRPKTASGSSGACR